MIAPRVDKITVAELAEDLKTEYRANGRKSLDRVEDAIEPLLPIFGALPAVKVTSADVTAYQARRQAEGAANATINRECAALKRLFSLAVKGEKIHRAPHIGMLQERNIRTGFFEDHQYEAVRAHLPAYAQPVVTFAYLTGWRVRSEVLTLQWRQVDFKAGIIRLDPGTTKNLEGRVFVMTPELRATLEAQLAFCRPGHRARVRGVRRGLAGRVAAAVKTLLAYILALAAWPFVGLAFGLPIFGPIALA